MSEPATVAESEVVAPSTSEPEAKEETAAAVKPEDDGTVNLQEVPEPDPEEPEAEETPEGDDLAAEGEPEEGEAEDEEDEEPAEVEMTDINFGGNKLEVPKDQLEKFPELGKKVQEFADNTWRDYTKGKQEVVATAASQKEQQVTLDKMESLQGDMLETYSHGLQLQKDIAQLQVTPRPTREQMDDLYRTNPDQYRRVSDQLADVERQITKKQAEFQAAINQVGQFETDFDAAKQDDLARRSKEGTDTLDRKIKNFTAKHAQDVVKYAIDNGIPEADAQQYGRNPIVTEMAYKAMMYDRMQTKKTAPKLTTAKVTPIKAPKGAGRATAKANDPATESDAAFAKRIGIGK